MVVMDVEEVLRIAGDCVTDRPKVVSEEGAGAVDIAVVLEDERLQKVDSCVGNNAVLLQRVDIRVADPVVVLSEKDSDDCIVEVGDSLITAEADRNVVANIVEFGMIEGSVDG